MGDDPYLPELTHEAVSRGNGSAATGGSSLTIHHGLSKEGQLFVVILSCLSLGLSLGGALLMSWGLHNVERRLMDRANLAEREARIAQDKLTYFETELAKKGIFLSTEH